MNTLYKKQLLSFFLFFIISVLLIGQERQEFKGPLKIDSLFGNANYQYIEKGKDTIYDGSFIFQNSNLDALIKKKDVSFLFQGNFNSGIATDIWKFQFGEFKSNKKGKIVDNEYRLLISGIQEQTTGEVINGNPNGIWTYEVNNIQDSKVENTQYKSTFIFENGVPQQNFQIENEERTLIGRFLRNGLAHDEWLAFASKNVDNNESWLFNEGLLEKIKFNNKGNAHEILIFDANAASEFKNIRLDANYLKLLQIVAELQGQVVPVEKGIIGLLNRNEKNYQNIASILKNLGSEDFLPNLKVKAPYYPLSTQDTILLLKITLDFKTADSISKSLLTNSHINIIKHSDPNAFYNYELTKEISKAFLEPIEKVVALEEAHLIQHLNPTNFIKKLWPEGMPSTSLTVISDSLNTPKTFSLANKNDYNFSNNNISALAQLTEYAKLSLEEIKKSLANRMANEERLQMLNVLDKELIVSSNSLKQQIDSSAQNLPEVYKVALLKIQSLSEGSLKKYASIKNPNEKLVYGQELKTCLLQLSKLSETASHLPDKITETNTLYQDAIWNPFMATVMNEEIKKRITTAYSQILVPYFIKEIRTNLTCENAETLTNEITHTNKRIEELRDEDTHKLERKLRKATGVQEIMKLLHQQPNKEKQ